MLLFKWTLHLHARVAGAPELGLSNWASVPGAPGLVARWQAPRAEEESAEFGRHVVLVLAWGGVALWLDPNVHLHHRP